MRAKSLAELIGWRAALKELRAENVSRLKAQETEAEAKIWELARTVETSKEDREVTCNVVMDYKANAVKVIRLDTKETVSSRAMMPAERQRELDIEKADPEKA